MGLGFKGISASWSYSGFNLFRNRLAKEIGINLVNMEGFGGQTSWKMIKDDIKPFLNHSDCDGSLGPVTCGKVARRIEELVDKWSDRDYDKEMALSLALDMRILSKNKKRLIFC